MPVRRQLHDWALLYRQPLLFNGISMNCGFPNDARSADWIRTLLGNDASAFVGLWFGANASRSRNLDFLAAKALWLCRESFGKLAGESSGSS